MTISTTENRKSYAGNGVATSFAFPYWFPEDGDLVVLLVNDATEVAVTQVLNTHYTVTGAGVAAGGAVEMVTKPATGETLVIYRDAGQTQGLDLVEKDEFPVNEVEIALDKLTVLIQRTGELILRATRMPESETSGLDMVLPTLETRKGNFAAWDSAGKWAAAAGAITGLPVSPFMEPVILAADAPAAGRLLETLSGANLAATTGTDTYLSANTPVFTALITGAIYAVDIPNANTVAAPNLAVDAIAAVTIKGKDGTALTAGEIKGRHLLQYDGTDFLLLNRVPVRIAPSFNVHRNGAAQSNITGIDKVEWATEEFDTNNDFSLSITLDNAAAVDKGGGLVGIPSTAHGLSVGENVTISGTTNYNGNEDIVSVTADEFVITAAYNAETFAGTETCTVATFKPTVAGKYLLSTTILFSNVINADTLSLYLYKNGADFKRARVGVPAGSIDFSITITVVADANGSTDYFEIFAENLTRNTSIAFGGAAFTYFTGCKIS